jgi:hypothetical protein
VSQTLPTRTNCLPEIPQRAAACSLFHLCRLSRSGSRHHQFHADLRRALRLRNASTSHNSASLTATPLGSRSAALTGALFHHPDPQIAQARLVSAARQEPHLLTSAQPCWSTTTPYPLPLQPQLLPQRSWGLPCAFLLCAPTTLSPLGALRPPCLRFESDAPVLD